jgi:hypothetical protein
MGKIITIHQPNYLPWIGLFSKVSHADCFLIGDTYLLGGQSMLNRNKIRTINGWKYLTVPIGHKYEGTMIHDIPLPEKKDWQQNHWNAIYNNYLKAVFFEFHKGFFKETYQKDYRYLHQINENIIYYLLNCFNIKVEIIRASDLGINPNLEKTDLMIALLKAAGASTYLSGPSGRNYLETEKFARKNIELKFFNFQHPVYKQNYPNFESNMSAIDLLFNVGPEASELVKSAGTLEDLAEPALIY